MYLSYYNLQRKPFEITTDPELLWWGDSYKKVFALLKKGVSDSKELIVLTGDLGLGKTTLINALICSLDENTLVARLAASDPDSFDFNKFVADAFRLDQDFRSKDEFLSSLAAFFHSVHEYGQKVVLIIDEAHLCNYTHFAEIYELLSLGEDHDRAITVILVGQNELIYALSAEENRLFEAKDSLTCQIDPLTRIETGDYIRHCLHLAGSEKSIFSFDAIEEIHAFSEGNPYLINILCDLVLATGCVTDVGTINPHVVVESAEKLQLQRRATEDESERKQVFHGERLNVGAPGRKKKINRWVLYLTLPVGALIIGTYLYLQRPSIPAEKLEGSAETDKKITAVHTDKIQKAAIIQNRIPMDSNPNSDETLKAEDPPALKETPTFQESGHVDSSSSTPPATQQPSRLDRQASKTSVAKDTAAVETLQDSPKIDEIRRFEIPVTVSPKELSAKKAESEQKDKIKPSVNLEDITVEDFIEVSNSDKIEEPIDTESNANQIDRNVISNKTDYKDNEEKKSETAVSTPEKQSSDSAADEPDPADAIDWLIKKRSK